MGLVKYVIWQVEIGASGTRHLQGYFVVASDHGQKGRVSPKFVKDKINSSMHFEKRMGTHDEARKYCSKKESRVPNGGPWEFGSHVDTEENKSNLGEKRKAVINDVKEQIDQGASLSELWDKNFGLMVNYSKAFEKYSVLKLQNTDRKAPMNFVFWGPPGTGKTHRVITSLRRLGATAYWFRPGVNGAWFDGYDPLVHNAVVFDEFKGQLPYTLFLSLLDKYPTHVEGKGSSISFRPEYIFITSNYAPNEWYGRQGEKKFHSTSGPGEAVIVEKAFDSSALLRRLEAPIGKVYFMDKKYEQPDNEESALDFAASVIEASDDEHAEQLVRQVIDLTSPPESPVRSLDDNPYENYRDDFEDGYEEDEVIDENEIGEALDEHRAASTLTYISHTPTKFKKLGKEPVQTKLVLARKRRLNDDDDDDVDDKIENSQRK